jgi:hypothetical protein
MKKILLPLMIAAAVASAQAGWLDHLGLGQSATNSTASAGLAALSQS